MTGRPGRSPRWGSLLAVTAAISVAAAGPAGATAAGPASATAAGPAGVTTATVATSRPLDSRSWTVYHHDGAGTGVAPAVAAVDTATRAWTSPALDGQIYGEPLVASGRVYVATQNDTVYALSAATGAVAWSRHLGRPVPARSLPCGDITPTVGITGTPVIDPARGEIFVVADELVNGTPAHLLVGLSTASGTTEMTRDVDPAGADTAALLQRTGLTLDAGQVVFGFGGNFGDCASYRGRLAAVSEAGGAPAEFTVDAAAGQSQGAIWMGGAAPAVDSSGHLWVTVGNGSVTSAGRPYDDSDSVLELSRSLRLLQFFAPDTWAANNSQDLDMSTEPALLANGEVMIAGKSRTAYLLNGAHLGGIGRPQASLGSICSQDVDGGAAVRGTTVYLPCLSGIIAVRAEQPAPALRLLWNSGTGGGPPIVAAGLVWTIGQNGTLYGLDPATGKVRQQAPVGAQASHFPTPSAGDGLLLAPSADHVVAFTAAAPGASATAAPVTTPATTPRTTPGPASAGRPAGQSGAGRPGTVSPGIIAGIVAVLVLIGGLGWFGGRRRAGRHR